MGHGGGLVDAPQRLTLHGTSAVWQRVAAAPVWIAHLAVWGDALLTAHVAMFRDQRLFEVAQATLDVAEGSEQRLAEIVDTLRDVASAQKAMLERQEDQGARAQLFAGPTSASHVHAPGKRATRAHPMRQVE